MFDLAREKAYRDGRLIMDSKQDLVDAIDRMKAVLRAVSEQSPLPGDSGDTIVPGFIMEQVREFD